MNPETDKKLDFTISNGQHLCISSLVFDAIGCRVEIGFTPDPDSVACDRKAVFRAVSDFTARRLDDCGDEDVVCYGDFMGIHRDLVPPANKRADFLLNTGDAEIQFTAAADVEVKSQP